MQGEDFERAFKQLRDKGVKFFEVVFQDLGGVLRGRVLKPEKPDDVARGFRIDAFSTGFSGVEDSDATLLPDLSTLRVYESSIGRTGFLIGDLYRGGKPMETYPRNLLKKWEAESRYKVLLGAELEFYLARDYKPVDNGGYMYVSPYSTVYPVIAEIVTKAEEAGLALKAAHHEVGPGQYEVLPTPMSPLALSDAIVFLKKLIWEAASARGLQATFMPKPFNGLPGNGLHVHISVHDGDRNVLFEDGELTEEGRSVIGGLLAYTVPLILFTNPTVNSYKRLVPGFEAPIYLTWGRGNRSTMIRVPMGLRGASGVVEYRLPDSSGNVYLKALAVLYSAERGLRERVDPGPECRVNAFLADGYPRIPGTLGEALEKSLESIGKTPELRDLLSKVAELEKGEWRRYLEEAGSPEASEVTEWEVKRYFLG